MPAAHRNEATPRTRPPRTCISTRASACPTQSLGPQLNANTSFTPAALPLPLPAMAAVALPPPVLCSAAGCSAASQAAAVAELLLSAVLVCSLPSSHLRAHTQGARTSQQRSMPAQACMLCHCCCWLLPTRAGCNTACTNCKAMPVLSLKGSVAAPAAIKARMSVQGHRYPLHAHAHSYLSGLKLSESGP